MYPNPAKDNLSIEIKGVKSQNNTKISIYNSMGQFICNVKVNSEERIVIDTSNYPLGLYFVMIHSENGLNVERKRATKFVVKH